MKTPEKIYINPEVNNYNSEIPFTGSVEYIRSDIAEQMAKETLSQLDSPLTALLSNTEYRQYVKEFINSRKK
jgi:hypothetical protein